MSLESRWRVPRPGSLAGRRRVPCRAMSDEDSGLRERLTKQGEETIGKLAQDLLENPLVNGAIARAFEAREKAAQAQEAALGALNIPSAADIERLTRRVRSVSQRLESIEDAVDRLDGRLEGIQSAVEGLDGTAAAVGERSAAGDSDAIAERLDEIARDLASLREGLEPARVVEEVRRRDGDRLAAAVLGQRGCQGGIGTNSLLAAESTARAVPRDRLGDRHDLAKRQRRVDRPARPGPDQDPGTEIQQ